jgi:hypothetical protein
MVPFMIFVKKVIGISILVIVYLNNYKLAEKCWLYVDCESCTTNPYWYT